LGITTHPSAVRSCHLNVPPKHHTQVTLLAGRLIAGFTVSEPGNWTSWPPHEHTAMLEEMYVFFDMPEPSFGIQMVYNDTLYPELVTAVRDGDAVLMPSGFSAGGSGLEASRK
jgi:5-deoxy-D-glucuronate isomerase